MNNFKLVSKQNIGVVLFLLVLIFISQSRLFDFLFYTTLGRAFFIFLLLIISYLNKILGVVTVLLAIVMINNKDEIYFEGFNNGGVDPSGNVPPDASGNVGQKPGPALGPKPGPQGQQGQSSGQQNPAATATKAQNVKQDASGNVAAEGFDILGTENNLKRGKKSNSIPVNNSVRKSGNVDPYYSSSFGNNYSQF